jgi:TolA-binding protein
MPKTTTGSRASTGKGGSSAKTGAGKAAVRITAANQKRIGTLTRRLSYLNSRPLDMTARMRENEIKAIKDDLKVLKSGGKL